MKGEKRERERDGGEEGERGNILLEREREGGSKRGSEQKEERGRERESRKVGAVGMLLYKGV